MPFALAFYIRAYTHSPSIYRLFGISKTYTATKFWLRRLCAAISNHQRTIFSVENANIVSNGNRVVQIDFFYGGDRFFLCPETGKIDQYPDRTPVPLSSSPYRPVYAPMVPLFSAIAVLDLLLAIDALLSVSAYFGLLFRSRIAQDEREAA